MADIIIDGTSIGANRFLLLDSTGKIPAVDGSQITTIAAGNIATGTIPIARIDTGTTANKIVKLDGNAKLPALDGSLLTNVSSSTSSASDPTISTNPSGGVGTEWHNTTSGEVYICTDATAGANVWTNVGAGSGDVQPVAFQGTVAGYVYGDMMDASNLTNNIDKISLVTDGNSTDVGDTTAARGQYAGQTAFGLYGYCSGGQIGGGNASAHDTIDKLTFSSEGNMTDVGNLSIKRHYVAGQSSSTHGYTTCSYASSGGGGNVIDKFSFSADGNAVDVANNTAVRDITSGASSLTHGYGVGGGAPLSDVMDKFQFSNDGDATDIGNILAASSNHGGTSSLTHGYVHGGYLGSAPYAMNVIQKYSFSADGNSTDVGDLTTVLFASGSVSSMTYGYTAGGDTVTGTTRVNVIQKYSFSTDGNSTDVGDLVRGVANYLGLGSQY